ncbi:hypothetical protein T4D_4817, partial [Trichinella pseudospiralis]
MPFSLSIPVKRISLDFVGIECLGKQLYCLFVKKKSQRRWES